MEPDPAQDGREKHTLFFAECRVHSRKVSVAVHDMSIAGCMVDHRGLGAHVGERVLIKPPGLGYLAATVLWVDGERAGLGFEPRLYEPVHTHLLRGRPR